MFISKLFAGTPPEKLENRGDRLMASGRWGEAKQILERALLKLAENDSTAPARQRLTEKLARARDMLAREHAHSARLYAEGGYDQDAREMLTLALTVADGPLLISELQKERDAVEQRIAKALQDAAEDIAYDLDEIESEAVAEGPFARDEEFFALCQTLPDDVRQAFLGYGETFQKGYLALNHGDFADAVKHLNAALVENPQTDSYIPMELATAHMHLNNTDAARPLLENFLARHPDALPAYRLLCEIYWDQQAHDKVDALLASIPDEYGAALTVVMLQGENHMRAGRYPEARRFYMRMLDAFGWHNDLARELAKAHEALGQVAPAWDIYGQIIQHCGHCHQTVDPLVRRRYAELSFDMGRRDTALLETYLGLAAAAEEKENRSHYFDRVSQIYADQGHDEQARRFHAFAVGLKGNHRQPS